ncbi:MAG: GntR family transcriptional regulator [Oscillospiraceae bacterium]|nr:GntR family transcriptional regulator [Oscillospiraceae bacterium]
MILLDPRDRRPLYEQIAARMEELMVSGALLPGDSLPSVRSLAADLSINPNTVQRAYLELERRGLIFTAKGRQSTVAGAKDIREAARIKVKESLRNLAAKARGAGMTREEFTSAAGASYDASEAHPGAAGVSREAAGASREALAAGDHFPEERTEKL